MVQNIFFHFYLCFLKMVYISLSRVFLNKIIFRDFCQHDEPGRSRPFCLKGAFCPFLFYRLLCFIKQLPTPIYRCNAFQRMEFPKRDVIAIAVFHISLKQKQFFINILNSKPIGQCSNFSRITSALL